MSLNQKNGLPNFRSRPIIVDAANLAYDGGRSASLNRIRLVEKKLQAEDCQEVTYIVDAAFRWKLDPIDRDQLERDFAEHRIHQAPAGAPADQFIINLAREKDGFIVSNDQFKEYRDQWDLLGRRLVKALIVGDTVTLSEPPRASEPTPAPFRPEDGQSPRKERSERQDSPASAESQIREIRKKSNRSWVNLLDAVRSEQGHPVQFSTGNVEASSKSIVRKMLKETGWSPGRLERFIEAELAAWAPQTTQGIPVQPATRRPSIGRHPEVDFLVDLERELNQAVDGFSDKSILRHGESGILMVSTGHAGFKWSFYFAGRGDKSFRVELFIWLPTAAENRAVLDTIRKRRQEIESCLGMTLTLKPPNNDKTQWVAAYWPVTSQETSLDMQSRNWHEDVKDWAVKTFLKMERCLGPIMREFSK